MADDKNSESKMLEISGEAHKLTQMINSWPQALNFEGRSKDITKDLMRGAFDLQESLLTLKKLQEASKVMSHKKAREREPEVEEVGFGLMGTSGRFERLAMDGSLFNFIDELKKVIRESNCSQHPVIVPNDDKVSSSRSLGFLMSTERTNQPKKEKGPNLIAKLMGLEGFPSKTDHPTRKEQRDDESLVQQRSIPAIKQPKTRKLPWMKKKPEPRTKTVKDIVEIVKSKEAQESDEIKECETVSFSGPRFNNEVPTSVPMRTPQLPCSSPQFDKVRLSKRTLTINENGRMFTRKSAGKEEKNMKRNKVVSYRETANLASVGRQQQSKVLVSTREESSAGLKPIVNGKQPGDTKEVKAIVAPKPEAKVISRALTKCNKRRTKTGVSSNDQLIVSKGGNASRKHNPPSLKPISQNFTDLVKVKKMSEAKQVTKSMDIKAVTGNAKCKDVKEINQNHSVPVDTSRNKVEQNATSYNREYTSEKSELFCEVLVNSSKGDRSSRSLEEPQFPSNKTDIRTWTKVEEVDVQLLLLSSQSFISRAQKLFGLNGCQTIAYQRKGKILEPETSTRKLLVDCAKELLIRKRHQLELSNHQMLQTSFWSLAVVSVDQLVDEISHWIEKLNGYNKNDAGVSLKDSVYVRLKRDLGCKDMMLNAMWDVGWENLICVEEADHPVGRVEELIFCGLVEELVLELVCW